MKTRILVLLILLIPSVLFFLGGSCDSNGGGVTATMTGTWVNPDYDEVENSAKSVSTDNGDGTFTVANYDTVSDTEPKETFTVTLTDEWTDAEGNVFLKIYFMDNGEHIYMLSDVDYPTEIDPDRADELYQIYYRQ
jgi:hypothetical protein